MIYPPIIKPRPAHPVHDSSAPPDSSGCCQWISLFVCIDHVCHSEYQYSGVHVLVSLLPCLPNFCRHSKKNKAEFAESTASTVQEPEDARWQKPNHLTGRDQSKCSSLPSKHCTMHNIDQIQLDSKIKSTLDSNHTVRSAYASLRWFVYSLCNEQLFTKWKQCRIMKSSFYKVVNIVEVISLFIFWCRPSIEERLCYVMILLTFWTFEKLFMLPGFPCVCISRFLCLVFVLWDLGFLFYFETCVSLLTFLPVFVLCLAPYGLHLS